MSIAEGIAAARLAMDSGTKALDLLRTPKIDGEAVRNRITEMQDLVFSAQRALGEAEEDNRQLRRQLDDRQVLEALKLDLEYQKDGGFYIRKSERDAGNPVSYCPVCWGADQKAVPLTPEGFPGGYFCA